MNLVNAAGVGRLLLVLFAYVSGQVSMEFHAENMATFPTFPGVFGLRIREKQFRTTIGTVINDGPIRIRMASLSGNIAMKFRRLILLRNICVGGVRIRRRVHIRMIADVVFDCCCAHCKSSSGARRTHSRNCSPLFRSALYFVTSLST